MNDKLILSPEQLFFLGTLMDAQYINYDYLAAMGELSRQYSRTRRKCLNELTQAGVIRERLSGEISVRPGPRKLLNNLFFGTRETALEVFTLGSQPQRQLCRFHWMEGTVTRVLVADDRLVLSESSPEEMESLLRALICGKEHPAPLNAVNENAVTRVITAKRAEIGVGSEGIVLFEQAGGLYTVDGGGVPAGIPGSQARRMLLAELKGE